MKVEGKVNAMKMWAWILVVVGMGMGMGCARGGVRVERFEKKEAGVLPRSGRVSYGVDWMAEEFLVGVPEGYDGGKGFGLIVAIPGGAAIDQLPAGWEGVMAKRKLLLVSPRGAVNKREMPERLGLAVIAAKVMQARYRIEAERVYVAGLSGGARTASALGFYFPELFRGTVQSCGSDFYKGVPEVKGTLLERDHGRAYGVMEASEKEIEAARGKVRFVIVTGAGDFRYKQLLDIFEGGFKKEGFAAKLIDVAGMKHEWCGAEALEEAVGFIEGGEKSSK